jgi:prepilin-type N-terminal cleavage/methylation domain-containing protein
VNIRRKTDSEIINGRGFTPLEKTTPFDSWCKSVVEDICINPSSSFVKKRNSLTGFTIIELMVVIAIMSLLLGLLLPVLGRVRANARETVCRSRLLQWSFAFASYAEQNEGYYPHIDGRDRTEENPATDADIADYYYGWIDVLPPLMGTKSWRDWPYGQKPGTGTIFQCPSARLGPRNLYKYPPDWAGYFSYAMNSCLELDENCWRPYGYPKGTDWQMESFLKITAVKNPRRLILLFDQLLDPTKGYGGKRYNTSAGKYCGSYPKAFAARHARTTKELGGNILYCDYHVEWKKTVWKTDWPDDLEVPPYGDTDWYP